MSVISKTKVPIFEPVIHWPFVYEKDENLKKFLLSKLINAEYASLKAPAFSSFSEKTLEQSLQKLCETLEKLTSSFTSFEFGSNVSSNLIIGSIIQPGANQVPDAEIKSVNPSIPSPNGDEASHIISHQKGKNTTTLKSLLRKISTMDTNTASNNFYKQNKLSEKSVKVRKTFGKNNTVNQSYL